jgi:hypothetical protein
VCNQYTTTLQPMYNHHANQHTTTKNAEKGLCNNNHIYDHFQSDFIHNSSPLHLEK